MIPRSSTVGFINILRNRTFHLLDKFIRIAVHVHCPVETKRTDVRADTVRRATRHNTKQHGKFVPVVVVGAQFWKRDAHAECVELKVVDERSDSEVHKTEEVETRPFRDDHDFCVFDRVQIRDQGSFAVSINKSCVG